MKFKNIVFAVLIIINQGKDLKGQSEKDIRETKISISVSQKPLKNVIQEIEKQTNLIFSYNSAKINIDSLVSINSSNTRLIDVLNKIFSKNISFQISSNNVILFPVAVKTNKSVTKPKLVQTLAPAEIIRDTVWLCKTDTIVKIRVDTLIVTIRDTIIKKQVVYEPNTKNIKNSSSISMGIFYQFLKPKSNYEHFGLNQEDIDIKKLIYSSESSKVSYRLGFIGSVNKKNIVLSTGLSFLKINEGYNYRAFPDSLSLGTNVDTLMHKTGKSQYNYISLPFFIGYVFKLNPRFNVNTNFGAWCNYLISAKGICMKLNSKPPYILNEIQKSQLNNFTFDLELGFLLEYMLSQKLSLKMGPTISLQIGSDYVKDYPVTKQKKAFGIFFSLFKYF